MAGTDIGTGLQIQLIGVQIPSSLPILKRGNMWQTDVLKLINDWIHKVKLIDLRYWSCPTLDNPILKQGLSKYNEFRKRNSSLVSANDCMHYSWGLPRVSGKSAFIKELLDNMHPDATKLVTYAKTHFVHFEGLGKLLILIDEYPPTWEILQHHTIGRSKDILIVKIETPKLA